MKTQILLTIEHADALPDEITDVAAQRVYGYIHTKGGKCGDVTAEYVYNVRAGIAIGPMEPLGGPFATVLADNLSALYSRD
jgi:hypothetical protein